MTPERWLEVKRVVQQALERDGADRAALLNTTCAGDPSLRAEVDALLRGDSDDQFLEPASVARCVHDLLAHVEPVDVPPRTDVRLAQLPANARVSVTTRNTAYEILLRDPSGAKVLVAGGRFSAPTPGRVLRDGRIRVGDRVALSTADREVVTGPVVTITVSID
jgi:hypothetical protein